MAMPRAALEVALTGPRCCDARTVTATDHVQRAANTVFRMESAKLIAGLTRIVRDVGLAEELAQDALVAALEHWPREGMPRQPRRLVDGDRQAPGDRRAAPQQAARPQAQGDRADAGRGERARGRGDRSGGRRRRRRRSAAPHLHVVPPGAVDRGAGGADASPAGRAHHRGDRARVPGPGADGGAADRPRQEDPGRGQGAVRGAARRRSSARGSRRCWRSSTSSSTRATRPRPATTGCGRRCARTLSASGASWRSWRRASPRCTGWWR